MKMHMLLVLKKGGGRTQWHVGLPCIESQKVGSLLLLMPGEAMCLERSKLEHNPSFILFSPLLAQLDPEEDQLLPIGTGILHRTCRVIS